MIPCPQVVPRTEVGMFTCLSATILNSRALAVVEPTKRPATWRA